MKEQKITVIKFDGVLMEREIPSFRGAVISVSANNPIFHNHSLDKTFSFRYPIIQYKVLDGNASLVGLAEGAESLERLFPLRSSFSLQIGRDLRDFTVKEKSTVFFPADESSTGNFRYFIRGWLPFSAENYHVWKEMITLAERVNLLDTILRGNILTLYKSFGVYFTREIKANIVDMSVRTVSFKGVKMNAFDISVITDTALPVHLGIGKGVSHGFGVIENLQP